MPVKMGIRWNSVQWILSIKFVLQQVKSNSKAFPLKKDIIDTWGDEGEKFDRFSPVYGTLAIGIFLSIHWENRLRYVYEK